MNHDQPTPTLTGPTAAPDFNKVRSYLRTIQQREVLGRFIKAGWTPAELGEFARAVFLSHGRSYPTAASYQYAMEKGPEHPFAQEVLAKLRAPDFTIPPFNRPVPRVYAWDDPNSPDHPPELHAEIFVMAQLWRNREAAKQDQPWPVEDAPIPASLWRRLFRLRNHYHSLDDTLRLEGLSDYVEPHTENNNQDYDDQQTQKAPQEVQAGQG